jgi:hypothetical protein
LIELGLVRAADVEQRAGGANGLVGTGHETEINLEESVGVNPGEAG